MANLSDIAWYLTITEQDLGDVLVLRLEGRIFGATAATLARALDGCDLANRHGLVLDFSGIDYINGDGLGVVEAAATRVKLLRVGLALCGLRPIVKTVFDLAGVFERLAIEPSCEAAVARLAQR